MSKLTTRQWATYNFIKSKNAIGKKSRIKDIAENYSIENFKDGYVYNTNPRIHNPCVEVCKDINAINDSTEVDKIIISDGHYGFWIAISKEQVTEYAKNLYFKRAMESLRKYNNMLYKCKIDGQCKIISNQDKVIDGKSSAKVYHDTFEHSEDA